MVILYTRGTNHGQARWWVPVGLPSLCGTGSGSPQFFCRNPSRNALVNEAYLRLVGQTEIDWQGKTHFFAIGAKVMRRILVDHARRAKSLKRGGERKRIQFNEDLRVSTTNDEDILALEEALEKLDRVDPRQAKIVELRFYGGLTVEEVAAVLGISKRTVESDWTMVRAWLRRELSGESTA